MEEITRYVYRAGGYPYVWPSWEGLQRIRFAEASPEQLATVTDIDRTLLTRFDCTVAIRAPENTKGMTGVDPQRQIIQARALQPYTQRLINNVRWVTCNFPCHALAQDAEMSLEEYADFFFGACLIDWEAARAFMETVKAAFDGARQVHITGPDTDLTLSLAGREGVICAGDKNMPDGEVFYAPVEDSAEGYITLFDEKIGGTIHLALGRAYEESGGTNQSAIHWDMIKDLRRQGRIEVDGVVVQENGRFHAVETTRELYPRRYSSPDQ
jgi:aminopeptidase